MSLDLERFDLVAEIGDFDYSWEGVFVYRDTFTGRLYGVCEGGCSCYGPGDNIDESDLVSISAICDLKPLLERLDDEPTAHELLDFKNKVRDALRDAEGRN